MYVEWKNEWVLKEMLWGEDGVGMVSKRDVGFSVFEEDI